MALLREYLLYLRVEKGLRPLAAEDLSRNSGCGASLPGDRNRVQLSLLQYQRQQH
jgi:hypothetical protein